MQNSGACFGRGRDEVVASHAVPPGKQQRTGRMVLWLALVTAWVEYWEGARGYCVPAKRCGHPTVVKSQAHALL